MHATLVITRVTIKESVILVHLLLAQALLPDQVQDLLLDQVQDLLLDQVLVQEQHLLLLHQHQHKLLAQKQHLMLQLKKKGVDQRVQQKSVASRTRMVGMGVLHTQSGATIINPGMPSERFRNVKSSAFVTGDLGHKPTCGVK
ncbi:hypothetical protein KY285_011297 [Solanum tuberosum]|nr:hypothetical protein KY285_011297 [Solanum tuberosum]